MARRYTSEIGIIIGPQQDTAAPDVNTNAQFMSWKMDTYSMNVGATATGGARLSTLGPDTAPAFTGANQVMLLRGGDMPGTLVQEDLQALALRSARLYGLGFDISLFFFACNSAVLGYLFLGAQFVPRLLGVLLVITGLSYLVQIFANFLLPSFGASLFPAFLLPAASALLLVNVWLALFGVNAAKWRAQADASGHRSSS